MTLKQLTELTDDGGTGQPDASIVVGVLEEASGKVDGYTRNRYVTPLQQSDEGHGDRPRHRRLSTLLPATAEDAGDDPAAV